MTKEKQCQVCKYGCMFVGDNPCACECHKLSLPLENREHIRKFLRQFIIPCSSGEKCEGCRADMDAVIDFIEVRFNPLILSDVPRSKCLAEVSSERQRIGKICKALKKDVPSEHDDSMWPEYVAGFNSALDAVLEIVYKGKQE